MTFAASDSVAYLQEVGLLHWRGGNRDKGMVLLLLAAAIAPSDARVLRSLAEVFIEQGDGERGLATIRKISEIEGGAEDLRVLTSRALWVSGDIQSARRMFQNYLNGRASR